MCINIFIAHPLGIEMYTCQHIWWSNRLSSSMPPMPWRFLTDTVNPDLSQKFICKIVPLRKLESTPEPLTFTRVAKVSSDEPLTGRVHLLPWTSVSKSPLTLGGHWSIQAVPQLNSNVLIIMEQTPYCGCIPIYLKCLCPPVVLYRTTSPSQWLWETK